MENLRTLKKIKIIQLIKNCDRFKEIKSLKEIKLDNVIKNNGLRFPFSICDYFDINYDLKRDGEFIWEKVADIKSSFFFETIDLVENIEFRLEEDENEDLCIFAKYIEKKNA